MGCDGDVMAGRGMGLSMRLKKAYLRPNLLQLEKLVLILLFLLWFARRSDGSARAHAPVDVLLFLFCWFQDLSREKGKNLVSPLERRNNEVGLGQFTWKEQSRLSSTLIMAPALSNSPQ